MKYISRIKSALLVITLSLSLPVMAQDLFLFPITGPISDLNESHITVADIKYRLSPTVKISLKGNKKGKLTDLEKGDFIGVTLIKIGKKRKLVDTIKVLK